MLFAPPPSSSISNNNDSNDCCSCKYCSGGSSSGTTNATSSSTRAGRPTTTRSTPYNYTTDAALIRLGNEVAKRVEPVHQFFSASYQAKKGFNYLQACAAAECALSGEFAPNSKIRHYSGYSIKPYPLLSSAEYQGNENGRDKLARILQASGSEGKRAWLEHKNLSTIETHTLLAAEISVNHEAREFFKDKPYAIAISKRSTERRKDVPYFLHYEKSSTVPGDSIILPLEYRSSRKWSTRSAREEQKEMQPQREIKGLHPIYEMLQPYHEENLLHPTREHYSLGNSTRHLPLDCKKWDCSICYSLTKFEGPIKYAAFLGG